MERSIRLVAQSRGWEERESGEGGGSQIFRCLLGYGAPWKDFQQGNNQICIQKNKDACVRTRQGEGH